MEKTCSLSAPNQVWRAHASRGRLPRAQTAVSRCCPDGALSRSHSSRRLVSRSPSSELEPLQPETGQPETCEPEPIQMEMEPSPEPCCSQSLNVQPPVPHAPDKDVDRTAWCSPATQSLFKQGLWKRRAH